MSLFHVVDGRAALGLISTTVPVAGATPVMFPYSTIQSERGDLLPPVVKRSMEKVGGPMKSSIVLPRAKLTPLKSFLLVWLRASATECVSQGRFSPAATDLADTHCLR